MRPIDADNLKKDLDVETIFDSRDRHRMRDLIDIQPTIEAEPVRRGRWKQTKAYPNIIFCGECGEPFKKNNSSDKWNYCPNCGALMEEQE